MAIPPFNNTRLNPHEDLTKKKQEELFNGITRNLEDIYGSFTQGTELAELRKKVAALEAKTNVGGVISAAGGIVFGSGFTPEHPAAGEYKIVLSKELATPAVLVGNITGTGVFGFVSPKEASKKTFTVFVREASGAAVNVAFSFIIRQT